MALCTRAGQRMDQLLLLPFRTACRVNACRRRARLSVIKTAGCTRFDRTGEAVSLIKAEEDANQKQLAMNMTVRHLHLLR